MVMDHQIRIQLLMMMHLIVRLINDKKAIYLKENHFENDIFLEKVSQKKKIKRKFLRDFDDAMIETFSFEP